jgi:hypothetical protein
MTCAACAASTCCAIAHARWLTAAWLCNLSRCAPRARCTVTPSWAERSASRAPLKLIEHRDERLEHHLVTAQTRKLDDEVSALLSNAALGGGEGAAVRPGNVGGGFSCHAQWTRERQGSDSKLSQKACQGFHPRREPGNHVPRASVLRSPRDARERSASPARNPHPSMTGGATAEITQDGQGEASTVRNEVKRHHSRANRHHSRAAKTSAIPGVSPVSPVSPVVSKTLRVHPPAHPHRFPLSFKPSGDSGDSRIGVRNRWQKPVTSNR